MSGEYTLRDHPDWRYFAEDDGGSLVLRVARIIRDGGSGTDAAADTTIVLDRTSEGFLGATHATVWPTQKVSCPVAFHTEVKSCSAGGLVLESVDAVGVDETCRTSPGPSPRREVTLIPADGGSG